LAVAVDVTCGDPRVRPAKGDRRAFGLVESSGAVPEEDRHGPAELTGDREVELAIAVQVGDGDPVGSDPGGERRPRRLCEAPPAVAEQDGDAGAEAERVADLDVRDDEVE